MCMEWHPFITLKRKKNRIDMVTDIKKLAGHYKKQIK